MKNRYHALELKVNSAGALVRFQYKIPETSGVLTGILPVVAGKMPLVEDGFQVGIITLEALNRKIHLASLPAVYLKEAGKRFEFYPVKEELNPGQMVNGSYLDLQEVGPSFTPYRIKLMFRVEL